MDNNIQPNPEHLYPEHFKLSCIANQSQALGEFLAWTQEQGWRFSTVQGEKLVPINVPIEIILAAYYEIDLNKIAVEKTQMHLAANARNN